MGGARKNVRTKKIKSNCEKPSCCNDPAKLWFHTRVTALIAHIILIL